MLSFNTAFKGLMEISLRQYSIFRVIFGILMIPQVLSILPSIHDLSNSIIVFHYPGLDFIDAYTHELVDGLAGIAIISSIFIALGFGIRLFSILFVISFGYLFLIDISFYNNHYYLWCLIGFLFFLSKKESHLTIFQLVDKNHQRKGSLRDPFMMGLLVSIVYFFGGIAKLNPDWLQGYPMRIFIRSKGIEHFDAIGYFISYVGLFFDLLVPFLIWKYASKWWFVGVYLSFHIVNYFLFNIGEFPLVMMGALLVFVPFKGITFSFWKEYLFRSLRGEYLLITFFIFQLVWPLRHFVIPGNVNWNRQGYYFAWRMMLNNQEVKYFQYQVRIPKLQKKYFVKMDKVLSQRQYFNCYNNPYLIWKLAMKLEADAKEKYKVKEVEVYNKSIITLNQHKETDLIKEVDLTKYTYLHFNTNLFITTAH